MRWWVMVAVSMVMLGSAGCSGVSRPSAAPGLPEPGPSSWSGWRPSQPVRDLAQLSEADKRAVRDADLAQRANRFSISDPPTVELERWIMPHERGPTAEACLADAGFTVKSHEDGHGFSLASPVPADQTDAYHRAIYVCEARFFLDPTYLQPLTHDQLVVIHEYYETYLIPCLREQGQSPSPLPSRETFIATYFEQGYSPYSDLELDDAALQELTAVCRQDPPVVAMFGE